MDKESVYSREQIEEICESEKSLEHEAIAEFPVPGRGLGWAIRGPPESLGMARMKKRPQRRRFGCILLAGKAQWKAWLTYLASPQAYKGERLEKGHRLRLLSQPVVCTLRRVRGGL